ncbi:MAG: hypothetical protein E7015_03720 [Alphaproteobacteria bacterium]|nr:hypothetical protein [Alphaproteobacteria bacterium]
MLPQLVVSTFPSQIFWVLVGFLCVFIFMTAIVSPRLQNTLDQRKCHLDRMCSEAAKLQNESLKLSEAAQQELNDAYAEVVESEKAIESQLKCRSQKKKDEVYQNSLVKMKAEREKIAEMFCDAFAEVSSDVDGVIDLALEKVGYTNGRC